MEESTELRNWAYWGFFFFLPSIIPNYEVYLALTDGLLHVCGICGLNVDPVNALCVVIQRALPSRKHFGKVNEKPGTVSSAPVKCPW